MPRRRLIHVVAALLIAAVAACGGARSAQTDHDAGADTSTTRDATPPDAAEAHEDAPGEAETSAPILATLVVSPASSVTLPNSPPTQFSAQANYSDGSTKDVTRQATWSSSLPSVAAIDRSTGLATPHTVGTTTITAAFDGITGSTSFMVASPGPTGIDVTPKNPAIDVGCPLQMTATLSWADGSTSDVTSTAAWSSSAPSTATIDAKGLLRCVAAGYTTIGATLFGFSSATTATCAAGMLTALAVTPVAATVDAGSTLQFTATGSFTSGSTCNVTIEATWQSTMPAVATIVSASTDAGLATGVAAGSTTIGAQLWGRSGSSTLTVQ